MTKELFTAITEWQAAVFPGATPLSKIAHLLQEIAELAGDIKTGNPQRDLEYADCFFLLFGAAAADGMTYEHICEAISRKFEINQERVWGAPDENGVVNHIKEAHGNSNG